MKRIVKHELVEVLIPAGSTLTKFAFPEVANLRNAKIWGLQLWENSQVSKSAISLKPTSAAAINELAFISLANYGGKNFIDKAPIRMFQTIAGAGTSGAFIGGFENDTKNLTGQGVNWTKSFIEVSGSVAILAVVDTVILFSVFYTDPADTTGASTFRNRK